MKRIILVLMIVGIILVISASAVFAGGGQVTGGTGNGQGSQTTNEIGCESQPCFSDAPQPEQQLRTGLD